MIVLNGNYLKTVGNTQNLTTRSSRASRRGFKIISHMFNLSVNQALANQICCTHNMDNMYIMTWNDRKYQNASKCLLPNGTTSKNTSSYILLDHFNTFGLSRSKFFFVANNAKEGVGGLDYAPFWAQGQLDWTKLAHCTSSSCNLQT